MSDQQRAVVRAPAKLTWSLRITGLRADGYHELDAEMVSLDLHDVVTIDPGGDGISVGGPFGAGVPTDPSNLVARALDLVGAKAAVTIDKRIPHGGGLGGGSADAAAVLRWAGLGASGKLGPDTLRRVATVGADVPFCLVGGRARVRGIGEIVEALPHQDRDVTLVVPPLRISTPAAYRTWDALGGPTGAGPNDLEPAALAVEPELGRWRDAIGGRVGRAPVLAGSGATWFVEGAHAASLGDLVDAGALVVETHTVPARREG